MSTREELKRGYKENPPAMGVFLVRNTLTNRFMLGASRNVEGALNKHRFMLSTAKPGDPHIKFPALLVEYAAQGAGAFEFKVLDVLKPKEDPAWDPAEDLAALEMLWRQELLQRGWQPYGTN